MPSYLTGLTRSISLLALVSAAFPATSAPDSSAPQPFASAASAQAPSALASPVDTLIAEAAAPDSPRHSTAEQRALRYPSAALLPSDITCLAASADSPLARTFLTLACLRHDLPPVQHASIGLTTPIATALAEQLSFTESRNQPQAPTLATHREQSTIAPSSPAHLVATLLIDLAQRTQTLSPAYLVLGCSDSAASVFEQKTQHLAATLGARPMQYKNMKGYRISLNTLHRRYASGQPCTSATSAEPRKHGNSDRESEERRTVAADSADRSVHLLYCRRGNLSLWVLTENPEEIRLPNDAADSLLATDIAAPADEQEDQIPHLIARLDAAPLRILAVRLREHGLRITEQLHKRLFGPDNIGTVVGDTAGDTNRETDGEQESPGKSFSALIARCAPSSDPFQRITAPLTLSLRYDVVTSTLHLQASGDACGLSFEPEPLYLTHSASDPNVIFSAESAPATLTSLPGNDAIGEILEHCIAHALTRGTGQQKANTNRMDEGAGEHVSTLYSLLQPSLRQAGRALRTVQQGLNAHGGLIVREQADSKLSVSLHAPVSNREQVRRGWDELMDAVDSSVTAVGMHPDVINMLPVAVQEGPRGSTSYRLLLPVSLPGFSPGILISDTDLLLGSNAEADRQLLEHKTSSHPLPGAVFHLNVRAAVALPTRCESELHVNENGFVNELLKGELLKRLQTITGCLSVHQGKARLRLLLHF